jgi:hypothetical protein
VRFLDGPDAVPTLELAHGVGGRQDLPIPFGAALAGAALALVVSFLVLGLAWRTPRLRGGAGGWPVPSGWQAAADAPLTRGLLATAGLLGAAYVAAAALLGPDDARNPTAGAVYVLLWVGVPLLSAVVGPVWRLLNPLRTVHLAVARVLHVPVADGLRPLPAGVGYWPAAAGLLAFVWLELVAPERDTTAVIRLFFALYCVAHLLAALVYGSGWFARGDAFEVYSTLVGRLSVLGRRGDGRLVLRSPLEGLDSTPAGPGLVVLVCVLLGSTAYDGMSNAPFWVRFAQSGALPATVSATAGLLGAVCLVLLAYVAAARLAGGLGHVDRARMPARFAHAVVPIALGYVVAHYYSLFVLESQQTMIRLSDPLGTGADWLGTRDRAVDSRLVTPGGVATLQVTAVVAGHVLGVVAAHDRAVRVFPRAQAVAGQLPLLVLMVAYTLTGLWLLFAG